MRVKYLFAFFSLLLLSNAYAQKKVTNTKWYDSVYQPELNEISRTEYLYDNKEKILYLITNDRDNMYVNLIVTEQASIRKILEAGLTVWIDVTAKNKKNLGIQFPVAREAEAPRSQNGDNSQPAANRERSSDGNRQDRPKLDENMQIELIGFENTDDSYFINADTENNINGHISFNEYHELNYQLKIPFENLYGVSLVNQTISLNLVSGKMTASSGGPSGGGDQNGGGRQGGGPPSGGSGFGGGGQGPPSGGGGMGMSQSQGSTSAITIKIKKLQIVDH